MPAKYFTLIMTPKALKVQSFFQISLPSEMGQDALFVDILLCPAMNTQSSSEQKDILLLCTTHLDSLETEVRLQRRQLELISQKLNEAGHANIVAGLIGGDMNTIYDAKHIQHMWMGLEDARQDILLTISATKDSQLNSSHDRVSGHTRGYQSRMAKWMPNCLDKFMYTGSIESIPLDDAYISEAKFKRLVIDLTVEIPLQVRKPSRKVSTLDKATQKVWASGHFGIAIGIKAT
jgi:hypothetical protein